MSDLCYADTNMDNVVSKEKMQDICLRTLKKIADYLSYTFGPMGSNTKIITGSNAQTIQSVYTKDGHKTLEHILFSNPIEMSIKTEIEDITSYVEHKVGDGTTSAVLLAHRIYEALIDIMNDPEVDVLPYQIIYAFQGVIKVIQDTIRENAKELQDGNIYDICMISTNGNKKISKMISNIYTKYGKDVQIDVGISNNEDFIVKTYDGLTIYQGYSDPAYINDFNAGTATINNAHIYAFADPIDDHNMITLFEKIIYTNIVEPYNKGGNFVPTVIIAPRMSNDLGSLMQGVIELMHNSKGTQKPPLLVITNIIGTDELIYLDIARLCGCKYIRKYINPEVKAADIEKGIAATVDTVCDFAGRADMVVSDVNRTKFINPSKMVNPDGSFTDEYNSLKNFLKAELDNAIANNDDITNIGAKKKRLKSLESNMIDFLVGGISVSDRDAIRDLVIDATKNCRSACENGLGFAANFEAILACNKLIQKEDDFSYIECLILESVRDAYIDTLRQLYSTAIYDEDEVEKKMNECMALNLPLDIRSMEITNTVVSSIESDIEILEAISKIITLMSTSNQCLLQAPQLNTY